MALTHVCMWKDGKGYQRVDVKEAAAIYPNTVSANSGIFVCELCGEPVLFTKSGDGPNARIRHFRHSRSEETKACEDRQTKLEVLWSKQLTSLGNHTLPVRIKVKDGRIQFSIGFPAFPEGCSAHCRQIFISTGVGEQTYVYSAADRLNGAGITYLNAGEAPAETYALSYSDASENLNDYWPAEVQGVNPNGTFFEILVGDQTLGRMILPQRKVSAQKSYYFLKKGQINHPSDMCMENVCIDRKNGWYLYRIWNIRFAKLSARFFLKYGLFLTESAVDFYPLWPVFLQSPYVFYYRKQNAYRSGGGPLYFFLEGDRARIAMYPWERMLSSLPCGNGKLVEIPPKERAQLVSLGNSGALGYFYLVQRPLHTRGCQAEVVIRTDEAALQKEDELEIYRKLPSRKRLWIKGAYDGRIIRRRDGAVFDIQFLRAGEEVCISDIRFSEEIEIWQGLRRVRCLCFEIVEKEQDRAEEDALLFRLHGCRGEEIPVPHSLGAAAGKLKAYPKLKWWLLEKIRKGRMPREAYQILLNELCIHEWEKL